MNLILHRATKGEIESFIAGPAHALLLIGQPGSGRGALARYISSQLLNRTPEKLANYPHFKEISPGDSAISIDDIRLLQDFVRLKTPGTDAVRRIIIMEDAEKMTQEAQNAFLKLLEEPPEDTVIIMNTANVHALLPTVVSRAQRIQLRVPGKADILQHFQAQNHSEEQISRAFYLSDGQIGLMGAILNEDNEHPLVSSTVFAKDLLSLKPYERLVKIEDVLKQKDEIANLLLALQRICHAAMENSSRQNKTREIKYWHAALKKVISAQQKFQRNAQAKLLLTDLVLNI